jgi:hypothetical protein
MSTYLDHGMMCLMDWKASAYWARMAVPRTVARERMKASLA